MFELKLKMHLSLSLCLQMTLAHSFALFSHSLNLSRDKCEQVPEDGFDGRLLIVSFLAMHIGERGKALCPPE